MQGLYRQGDVLLQKVKGLPENCVEQRLDDNRVVLAYGEVTGHAHALSSEHAKLYTSKAGTFLLALKGATLRHEEHAPIPLEEGVYRVIQQREYTPEAVRYVRD